MQVSYDEGQHWQPVPLTGSGDRRIALIRRSGATVSLRATAADADGNTVQQTIIRSYAS